MISNQIIQSSLDDTRAITRIDFCVMDLTGSIVATTFEIESFPVYVVDSFVASQAESQSVQGYNFFKIYDEGELEYVLIARGMGEDAYMIGKLAANQIQALITAYKERFDKNNFVQSYLGLDAVKIIPYLKTNLTTSHETARPILLFYFILTFMPLALGILIISFTIHLSY